MIVAYVAAFSAGLLFGVYAMLHGVERGHSGLLHVNEPRRFRFSLPALGAALTAIGVVGYAMSRWTLVGEPRRLATAIVSGGAVAALAVMMVKRWTRRPSTEHGDDPRYFLQGHPARVTVAMVGTTPGAIAFEVDGAAHATSARSADGIAIAADTDVVIERIEDGVAYVETWSQVEQRI